MSLTLMIKSEDLWRFSNAVLEKMTVPRKEGEIVSTALIDADLRGIETHGVVRLPQYVTLIKNGTINPKPQIKMIGESASHSLWDNDNGMGFLGSVKAMGLCIEKAKREGIAMAGVRNSSHFGAAGYYTIMAAELGLISFAASNAYPVMAPPGTITPTHGNNPLSYAFPAGENPPIVTDMATSVASQGRIKKLGNEGKPIPLGWAYDREGKPTDDPEAFSLLMPLGEGGYKGFGLAVAMDVLAGVLTGSLFARKIISGPGSRGCGHFFLVIDPQRFIPLDEFKKRMDEMIRMVKGAQPPDQQMGPISLPGERGFEKKKKRLREGIPVSAATLKLLERLGDGLEIPPLRRG
ncbi:MAG: Ldh family oxidoreductase [Thermodesulfobacteriota bacterium]|jgi:LDH2 family malate/lactate/ureidoglycolate dehydrogenase